MVCGGYKKDFKWRPFRETDVALPAIERQKRGMSQNTHDPTHIHPLYWRALADGRPLGNSPKQTTASAESSKPASPDVGIGSSSQPATAPVTRPASRGDAPRAKRDSVLNEETAHPDRISPRPAKAKRMQALTGIEKNSVTSIEELREPSPPPLVEPGGQQVEILEPASVSPGDVDSSTRSQFTPALGHSPSLTEMLMDASNLDNPDILNSFQLPDGFQPLLPLIDPSLEDAGINTPDFKDLDADDDDIHQLPLALRSRRASLSDLDPNATTPPDIFNRPINYIYPQPYFAEESPEMLTFRFDKLTCGILSIMDGPHENPWRTLIWPLAPQSPALYHAVTAMTAFHSASDVPALRIVGHEHKAASIRFIQEGIRDNSMGDQTAIATALALGFAESWDQHTATGNTHIKGAQALVKRALERHQQTPLKGDDLARLKFLCNAWVYMDVIARLTSVDSDESHDFDRTFVFSGNPNDCPPMVMGDATPGFGIDFGMPIDARLDPLMGCASTLFPLIGRVANLVRKVCRSQANSPSLISQANDLKIALEGWDPPAFIERPEDPSTDVQHTLQTAEAYRWATLLHLHLSVTELPSLTTAELAQRVLQYLATVPLASRTVIVQIYPLMVAGCEASTMEDREWIRARWAAMSARMRIGIIDKCLLVTEEVWRRRDNYERQPDSNRKLVATAELRPTRGRGQPLIRSPTGTLRPGDPGRTGMVFSYIGENEPEPDRGSGDEREREEKKKRALERRNGRDPRMSILDPAYTVRGHLHWVGVMWDWGWESRLSQ